MIGKDAVFPHHGDDVRGDADGTQIQQRRQFVELDAVVEGKRLHELETHAAAGEFRVGVVVVVAFRVQDGSSLRQHIVGHVVVADDEVHAQRLGIGDFLHRFDAAVQNDDEFHAALRCHLNAFVGDAVAFVVAVRDVVVNVGIVLSEELIDECDGGASIDIIVSIDKDSFLFSHGFVESVHGFIHVVHQERVVERGQLRTKELRHLRGCSHSPFVEQSSESRMNACRGCQFGSLFRDFCIGLFVVPIVNHGFICLVLFV